jgi:ribosomal protein S12 methylthiotransferase
MSTPNVAIVSLGCAKNLVDTEELLGEIYNLNFNLVAEPESADAVIVNTCGFIQSAVDESLGTLGEMLELKESGVSKVYAMGCYASRSGNQISNVHPNLDGVFPLSETQELLKTLKGDFNSLPNIGSRNLAGVRQISATLPHYSFLKISEGCNRTCTYCTIPSIRGGNVDKSIEELTNEARDLVSRGVKELNIIAQDTTAYGIEKYGEPKLLELLKSLHKVDGLQWIRLLYAYPDYLNEALADFLVEGEKMVPYLELPIQHAAPGVLRRMHRPDTFQLYDKLFDRLRAKKKDYALRTTVILGFPGETDEEFDFLYNYCKERRFDRLGAFKYFKEEGTPAYKMKNQVNSELVDERYDRLMSLQRDIHFDDNQKWVGKDMEIIIDEVDESGKHGYGRTWRDAVDIDSGIEVDSSIPLHPGLIATCRITGVNDYDLKGVL